MYGHACLTVVQARAFAPSWASFCAWYQSSAVQMELFGVPGAVVAQSVVGEGTASNTTPFSLNLRLTDCDAPFRGVVHGEG